MSRPLFLGEGVEDIGRIDAAARHAECDFEGDLPRLVRRLIETAPGGNPRFGYAVATVREAAASGVRQGRPARGGGKGKDLRDAVLSSLSFVDGARPQAVVALVDARLEEVERLRADSIEILKQCGERDPTIPVAIGLAIQEVEIWMLADPESQRTAFGSAAVAVGGDLESEPDPKARWLERVGQVQPPAGRTPEQHEDDLRRAAWASLRPDVVRDACPRGFAPFADEVRRVMAFLIHPR